MLEFLLRHSGPRARNSLSAQLTLVDDLERVCAATAAETAGKTTQVATSVARGLLAELPAARPLGDGDAATARLCVLPRLQVSHWHDTDTARHWHDTDTTLAH